MAVVWLLFVVRAIVGVASADGLREDFANYYNAGGRVLGAEPADVYDAESSIDGRRPFGWPGVHDYAGFPLSALAFAPLRAFSPRVGLAVLKATCLAAFTGGLLLLYVGFLRPGDPVWRSPAGLVAVGAVALLFEPWWQALRIGGQTTPIAFFCLCAFTVLYVRDHAVAAAPFLIAAAFMKPLFAVSGVVFLAARDWRFVKPAAAWAGVLVAASLLLLGVRAHADWFELVRVLGGSRTVSWQANASVLGTVVDYWVLTGTGRIGIYGGDVSTGILPAIIPLIASVYHALLLAGFVVLAMRVRAGDGPEEAKRMQLATLAILLPLLWPMVLWRHYLIMPLIPLSLLAARWSRLPAGLAAACLLFFAASFRASNLVTDFVGGLFWVNTWWEAVAISLYAAAPMLLLLTALARYARGWAYVPAPSGRTERAASGAARSVA